MTHSQDFEFYYWFYYYSHITKKDVYEAVENGWITKEEYKEITGEDFIAQ